MKKILFINPCLRYDAKRKYVPVGLAYILTAVEKARLEFELIDMDAYAISPGGVLRNQPKEFIDRYVARTPLARMAREDDFMGAVVYLASDLSGHMLRGKISLRMAVWRRGKAGCF